MDQQLSNGFAESELIENRGSYTNPLIWWRISGLNGESHFEKLCIQGL
jgi:hypothetical protein